MKKCTICKKEYPVIDKKYICNDCTVMVFDTAEDVIDYLRNCSNYILEHRDLIHRIEQQSMLSHADISTVQRELLDNLKAFQSLKSDVKMRISGYNSCQKERQDIGMMLFMINEIMDRLPDLIDKCKE